MKAILWDVDGTIAETERDGHRVAFNQAFAAHGLAWHWTAELYGDLLEITGGRERILRLLAEVKRDVLLSGKNSAHSFTTAAAGALSFWLHGAPGGLDGGDLVLGRWLAAWGDAWLCGMMAAIFVAFRPQWLATYTDRLYLPTPR